MEEIALENWESFERVVQEEHDWVQETRKQTNLYISEVLFRGHANKEWKLETTLERFCEKRNIDFEKLNRWKDYHHILRSINPFFSSFTEVNFDVNDFNEDNTSIAIPPCYEFMVHIRHHGFPSPLLDWTISPYVAAFFAFQDAIEEQDVAIYVYREYAARAKGHMVGSPSITGLGPYMNTHKRHYQQQCQYTICTKAQNDRNHEYCSHELAEFSNERGEQDFLRKYTIPGKERPKVLKKLNLMNINAFSLFGNEESMLSTLAYREIELKNT